MLPLLLNKIIQTDKLLFLHLVTQKNRIYTFLNPVSYLIALENKSLFEQFDGIFADGSLLVSAIRLVYGKRVTRRSFDMTSLAPELLNYLMESRKTLYIVASGEKFDKEAKAEREKRKNEQLVINGNARGNWQKTDRLKIRKPIATYKLELVICNYR